MSTIDTIPDVEGAMKDYLRAHALVTAQACGTRTFLEATRPTFPYNQVTRIGGPEDGTGYGDTALVQIDVWGEVRNISDADNIRRAIRVALRDLEETPYESAGKARLYGAVVRDDRPFHDREAQDADGKVGVRPRYIITATVSAMAAPTA